jgi:hypothetical protein
MMRNTDHNRGKRVMGVCIMYTKNRHIAIIAAIIFILCTGCSTKKEAAYNLKKGGIAYVTVAVLNFRSQPGFQGKREGKFSYGDKLVIEDISEKKEVIEQRKAYWYLVRLDKKEGWVFGGYLSPTPLEYKTAVDVKEKVQGIYYFCSTGNVTDCSHILSIDGENYIEKRFDPTLGISDTYTGKIAFHADAITLIPYNRKVRPSLYIDIAQNKAEEAASQNAHREHTVDEKYLVSLDRFPAHEGRTDLYFLRCGESEFLIESNPKGKSDFCQKIKRAYMRK